MDEQQAACLKKVEDVILHNKVVQTLIDSVEALGCKIPKDFFACRPCDAGISGGFVVGSADAKDYQPKVVVCSNVLMEQETFEHTLIHELIHAYDVCRVKKFDFENCIHHACTEIRASSLSGECNYIHEIARGNFTYTLGHNKCVKRRAQLSVEANPHCKVLQHSNH